MIEETKNTTDSTSQEASEEQKAQSVDNEVSKEEPFLEIEVEDKELFHQMMNAGVFYGRSKSRTNPLTKKYILTTRSGFEVIDMQKAIVHLKKAGEILKKKIAEGGTVLLVGTSPAVKKPVKNIAERLGLLYVTERWLGGTLTNFKTITKRISYFKKLKSDKASGSLDKYTKKERLKIDKELVKLEKLFGGIEELNDLPSLMFIADIKKNEFAAKEARQKNIPVIAFLNTDANPKLIDYPIPANDRNPKSVELLMEYLANEAEEGKRLALIRKDEDKKGDKPEAESPQRKIAEVKE